MNGAPGEPRGGPPGRARYLGFGLLALLMWMVVPVTLLLPLPAGQGGRTSAALLAVGGAALRVSAALFGREVVGRYRSCLDPRRLFLQEGP